jgi:hypothetical protein
MDRRAATWCGMSVWLDPLRAALGEVPEPLTVFFRDDDVGWRDDRLYRLLDVFARAGAPIDLSVIPSAASPELARRLRRRHEAAPTLVRLHQHGLAHRNHERTGRRCEFGPTRTRLEQLDDICCGCALLRTRLELEPDPIFTPPWNRCTADTAHAARQARLTILSREHRAQPLGVDGVRELPVSVDWFGRRVALGEAFAAGARARRPLGVMLHHAAMVAEDRSRVAELLAVLSRSPSVVLATMTSVRAAAPP